MVNIIQDGNELIAAGQFLTLGNGEVSLVLKHAGEQIQVIFIINEDDSKEANIIEGKIIKNDKLQITMTNFWNKTGVPVGPQLLGTLSNRQLYMILNVFGMRPAKSKQISYSFYLAGVSDA